MGNLKVKGSEQATTAVLKAILNCITTVSLLSSYGRVKIYSSAIQLPLGCLPDVVCDWLKSSHPAEPCQPTPPPAFPTSSAMIHLKRHKVL